MTIAKFQGGDAVTMTSEELLELINEARAESGEPAIRRNKLAEKIEDELSGEHYTKRVVQNLNSTESAVFDLTRDQCMLVSMRESKVVRRRVVAKLNALASQVGFTIPQTRAEAMRLAADLEEQNEVLALENLQQAKTIASLESLFMTGETPTQFCKRLNGVNCARVNSSLLALGWLYDAAPDENSKPRYRVASRVRDRYLTERPRKISSEGADPFIKYDLVLLLDGARRLHQLYMKGELAMKAKWDCKFTLAKYDGSATQ
jgi:hypothetical protein